MYQVEWDELIDAIRQDKPYNEVKRGAEASLVTSMGRMAAHTGQVVTYDQILNLDHEFAPDVDKLTMNSPRRCWPAPTASIPCRSRASSPGGSINGCRGRVLKLKCLWLTERGRMKLSLPRTFSFQE